MNLRKTLNIPNSAQRSLVDSEKLSVDLLVIKRQKEKVDTADELNHKHNFTCPKCQNSSEDTIVDRISNVSGGLYSTRTEPVNHCNECGNEWRKGNHYASCIFRMVDIWLERIHEGDIPLGLEVYSAEAVKKSLSSWKLKGRASLRVLRKRFYSVYDKK